MKAGSLQATTAMAGVGASGDRPVERTDTAHFGEGSSVASQASRVMSSLTGAMQRRGTHARADAQVRAAAQSIEWIMVRGEGTFAHFGQRSWRASGSERAARRST